MKLRVWSLPKLNAEENPKNFLKPKLKVQKWLKITKWGLYKSGVHLGS